jgi:hypothetical protein
MVFMGSAVAVDCSTSGVGLVCSAVLIFLGAILVTDNFHVPSNLLFCLYMGL